MHRDISVIIPVRDRFKYLKRAVESALTQTLPARQVIVVDDGSSKLVSDEIRSLDHRVKVIRYENGVNANYARNRGVDACRSEYVAFLDSDDWWHDSHLEKSLAKIVGGNYAAIFGAYFAVSFAGLESEQVVRPKKAPLDGETPSSYLFLSGGNVRTSTIVAKVDFVSNLRFDESLYKHQDWDFIVRAQCSGDIGFNCVPTVYIDHGAVGRMTGSTNLGATELFARKNRTILARSEYVGFLLRSAKHALEIGDCEGSREILRWLDSPMRPKEAFRWCVLKLLSIDKLIPLSLIRIYGFWLRCRIRIQSILNVIH